MTDNKEFFKWLKFQDCKQICKKSKIILPQKFPDIQYVSCDMDTSALPNTYAKSPRAADLRAKGKNIT